VMRSLAFTGTGSQQWNEWASLCCSCGLCTLYACPEELYPKEACDDAKTALREASYKWAGKTEVKVHPMRDGRHVPIKSLVKKLHVGEYDVPAPMADIEIPVRQIHLPLKQSAGAPCLAVVKVGDTVQAGQPVAERRSGRHRILQRRHAHQGRRCRSQNREHHAPGDPSRHGPWR